MKYIFRKYTRKSNFEYWSRLEYTCDDKRKWIKLDTEALSELKKNRGTVCGWRQTYDTDMSALVCVIHHCRHPYNDTGGFDPPADENNLNLKDKNDWDVPFNDVITYVCDAGMHIENDEIDPTKTEYNVTCTDVIGEYNTPIVQGILWPNCTQTVICGDPLEPPVNGSRTWLYGEPEPQQTYNTSIRYGLKKQQ